MAQMIVIKEDIAYLKDCVHYQQVKLNRQEKELSRLQSTEILARNSWQAAKKEINFLKEDTYWQQNCTRDLEDRVRCVEIELRDRRNCPQFSPEGEVAIWARMNRVETKINRFTQLHADIRESLLAFRKKCTNVLRVTLRLNNTVHSC